jgi:hypothetical protein
MAAEKELQSVAKIPQTRRQQKQIAIQARPVEDSGAGVADQLPSLYPVERPTKFELVINLKTAKALDEQTSVSAAGWSG